MFEAAMKALASKFLMAYLGSRIWRKIGESRKDAHCCCSCLTSKFCTFGLFSHCLFSISGWFNFHSISTLHQACEGKALPPQLGEKLLDNLGYPSLVLLSKWVVDILALIPFPRFQWPLSILLCNLPSSIFCYLSLGQHAQSQRCYSSEIQLTWGLKGHQESRKTLNPQLPHRTTHA